MPEVPTAWSICPGMKEESDIVKEVSKNTWYLMYLKFSSDEERQIYVQNQFKPSIEA